MEASCDGCERCERRSGRDAGRETRVSACERVFESESASGIAR